MIESKLEIYLVTYNRSYFLDKTLSQFKKSPFARCQFTIIDNCSSDNTPVICKKYADILSDYHIVRHRFNIGGNSNYLRAAELSSSPYTWILCDDVVYDFHNVADVIKAIESDDYDFIYIGSPYRAKWESGLKTTSRELIEKGSLYYHGFTFPSALIFRTNLFDSESLSIGYRLGELPHPNFAFIDKSVRENFRVYVSRDQIVFRNADISQGLTPLTMFTGWVHSSGLIQDKALRARVIEQAMEMQGGFMRGLFATVVAERLLKTYNKKLYYRHIIECLLAFDTMQRLKLLLLLPILILPKAFLRFFKRVKFKLSIEKGEILQKVL
jgi:glycosyltransferase involved in cell wall biosynthesis